VEIEKSKTVFFFAENFDVSVTESGEGSGVSIVSRTRDEFSDHEPKVFLRLELTSKAQVRELALLLAKAQLEMQG